MGNDNTTAPPPERDAPHSSASPELKMAWCRQRVPQVIARHAENLQNCGEEFEQHQRHLEQIEWQSCILDPQEYERVTKQELE